MIPLLLYAKRTYCYTEVTIQTIARANRVFADKTNGLIVDYVGVFRDLQKALAIYGTDRTGKATTAETPVQDKAELLAALQLAIEEITTYCALHDVDAQAIMQAAPLQKVALLDAAVDTLLATDEIRRQYLALAANVAQLYRAILPDTMATVYTPAVSLFTVLAKKMRATLPEPDIDGVMAAVEKLLDTSIASEGYVIAGTDGTGRGGGASSAVNLGQIDLVALMATFEQGQKHVAAQKLRRQLAEKIERLAQKNRTRADFMEKLQRLIEEYNAGSMNVETFFQQLVQLASELSAEEQRAVAEQLNEEELAIFDLLTRPALALTDAERDQVKRVARDLLATLKREKLVLDWRKRQATQADVMVTVRTALDAGLPGRAYSTQIYQEKCAEVYDHIFTAYADSHHSIYAA